MGVIIDRCHRDVTVHLLDNASNLGAGDVTLPLWINGKYTDDQQIMLQRLTMESRYDVPKVTPATKSSIEDLEKLRLDSLEATFRQMPSTICMEGLDTSGDVKKGIDHQQQHVIARISIMKIALSSGSRLTTGVPCADPQLWNCTRHQNPHCGCIGHCS
ncbi:hypothetical protein ABKV19_012273 [Rosa sericea]